MPGSLIVINPQASKARDANTLAALTERAALVLAERDGSPPRLVETASPEAVEPLVADALDDGVASVVGVGGDGTMRDIARVISGRAVPLGIIPAGTGNQVAAELGIPLSPLEAVDALERATPHTIDLGELELRRKDGSTERSIFLLGCGGGFDARLMATTSSTLKRRIGTPAYFLQGARLALRMSTTRCRLTIDERSLETEAAIVLVGNLGQLVPGRLGLRLPLDPSDGLLEVIVVSGRGPLNGLLGLLDQLRRTELGGEAGDRSVRLRGRSVTIEPVEPMPLQVDGDYVGEGSLHARIRPAALQVLAP